MNNAAALTKGQEEQLAAIRAMLTDASSVKHAIGLLFGLDDPDLFAVFDEAIGIDDDAIHCDSKLLPSTAESGLGTVLGLSYLSARGRLNSVKDLLLWDLEDFDLLADATGLTRLTIHDFVGNRLAGIERLKSLQYLEIFLPHPVDYRGVEDLPALEHLSLWVKDGDLDLDDLIGAGGFEALSTLEIAASGGVSAIPLQRLPSLTALVHSEGYLEDTEALARCPRLRSVDLEYSHTSDLDIPDLPASASLRLNDDAEYRGLDRLDALSDDLIAQHLAARAHDGAYVEEYLTTMPALWPSVSRSEHLAGTAIHGDTHILLSGSPQLQEPRWSFLHAHAVDCAFPLDLRAARWRGDLDGVKKLKAHFVPDLRGLEKNRAYPKPQLDSLEELSIAFSTVADFEYLAALPRLRRLSVESTRIEDLLALANLETLEELSIAGTRVSSLERIATFPRLRALSVARCPFVTSCAALAGNETLVALDLSESGVADFEELRSIPNLRDLVVRHAPTFNAGDLAEHPSLERLDLSYCDELANIEALASLPRLRELRVRRGRIAGDWCALVDAPALNALNLEFTEVTVDLHDAPGQWTTFTAPCVARAQPATDQRQELDQALERHDAAGVLATLRRARSRALVDEVVARLLAPPAPEPRFNRALHVARGALRDALVPTNRLWAYAPPFVPDLFARDRDENEALREDFEERATRAFESEWQDLFPK